MSRVCLVFLTLVCLSRAQIPSFGFCPDYLPMAHFDMERFLGKWYEAERYFQFSEVASRCVVADYAVGPNGKIYVSNEVTNRFTGVKRVIGGSLDLPGKRTEGKLVVKYDTTPISTTSTLTILDTDYDNFAVVWSCSGLGPVNTQSAWLMTRERIPDATTLQTAYGVLDRYKITRTFFVKTDQEGCAIAASDLNAALGIASTSTNVEQNADIDPSKMVLVPPKIKAEPIAQVLFKRGEENESDDGEEAVKTPEEDTKPESSNESNQVVEKSVSDEIKPVKTTDTFINKKIAVEKVAEAAIDPEHQVDKDMQIKKLSEDKTDQTADDEKIKYVAVEKKNDKISPDTQTKKDIKENNIITKV